MKKEVYLKRQRIKIYVKDYSLKLIFDYLLLFVYDKKDIIFMKFEQYLESVEHLCSSTLC
jgi:hypothetical protein